MLKLKKIGFQIAWKIKNFRNIFGPIVGSGWEIDERLSLLPGHFVNYLVHRLELQCNFPSHHNKGEDLHQIYGISCQKVAFNRVGAPFTCLRKKILYFLMKKGGCFKSGLSIFYFLV